MKNDQVHLFESQRGQKAFWGGGGRVLSYMGYVGMCGCL